jgi:hypothetical protein
MKVHLEKQDYSLFIYKEYIKICVELSGGIFSFFCLRIKLGSNGWNFQFPDELPLIA